MRPWQEMKLGGIYKIIQLPPSMLEFSLKAIGFPGIGLTVTEPKLIHMEGLYEESVRPPEVRYARPVPAAPAPSSSSHTVSVPAVL